MAPAAHAARRVAAVLFVAIVLTTEGADGAELSLVAPEAIGEVVTLDAAHSAPLGEARHHPSPLQVKQARFLKLLERAAGSSCSGGKAQSVFCNLVKGLKHKYIVYLKDHNAAPFKAYIMRMNTRFCTGPKKNLASRRCQFIPTLMSGLPAVSPGQARVVGRTIISREEGAKYAMKKSDYALGISKMVDFYCKVKKEGVFCKQLQALQKQYSQASASNSNTAFRAAFVALRKQYCERPIDFQTKRCLLFNTLMKMPKSFKVPTSSDAIDHSKLDYGRAHFFAALKKTRAHFCAQGNKNHPQYCELTVAMMKKFAVYVKTGQVAPFSAYMKNVEMEVCKQAPGSVRCKATKLLMSKIPVGKQSKPVKKTVVKPKVKKVKAKKEHVRTAKTPAEYERVLKLVTVKFCRKGADTVFCQKVKGFSRHFANAKATCDLSKYSGYLQHMNTEFCKTATQRAGVKCKLFVVLRTKMPAICTAAEKTAAKKAAAAKAASAAAAAAATKKAAAKHKSRPKAKHSWGDAHLANLTPKQKAYRESLNDVVQHFCVKRKQPFCKQAKRMSTMFTDALKMQFSKPYEQYLKSLRKSFCSKPADAKLKQCQLLAVLSKTMVSVAHMGPYAKKRLKALQVSYMAQTKNIYSHYCSVDTKSLFCQLTRGLERTYKTSLKHTTNILYEGYLTNMEHKYCSTATQSKRCGLFPILRRQMPISMTTLKTLPQKHLEFLNTVADVQQHFCHGKTDTSLFCEVSRGMKRVYVHSLNGEDNSDFVFYLTRVQSSFCNGASNPGLRKACKVLPVLKKGIPPPFLAEGVKRLIDGIDAKQRMAIAQAELHRKLLKDRAHYLKTLQDIHKHYCSPSNRTYFCLLTLGLVTNYKHSLHKSFENYEYRHFLLHMKRDFCVRGLSDGYKKRCKFIPMLIHGLPMSINAEKRLFHEQNEYLKALQDVVGHFCHLTAKSVFCQLCHGLVHQYVRAVATHSNRGFSVYLNNVSSKYCVSGGKTNAKQCKTFGALRMGIPGSGLNAGRAINEAKSRIEKARAALSAARQIRTLAQKSAKKVATKDSIAALENAAHRELQAEHVLQVATNAEIRKMAEKAGAPSRAAVRQRFAEVNAWQARVKSTAIAAKMKKTAATEAVTKAKAKVLQTTLNLARATSAVKKATTKETIGEVEKAMKASADAKASLKQVSKFQAENVKEAKQQAIKAVHGAAAARVEAIKLKQKQTRLFAQFTLRAAQTAKMKAEEAADFAKLNAKKLAQKLSWAKQVAKDVRTSKNQANVAKASHAAHIAAAAKESTAEQLIIARKAYKKAKSANEKASATAKSTTAAVGHTQKFDSANPCVSAKAQRKVIMERKAVLKKMASAISKSVSKLSSLEAARSEFKAAKHKYSELKKACLKSSTLSKKEARQSTKNSMKAAQEKENKRNSKRLSREHQKLSQKQGQLNKAITKARAAKRTVSQLTSLVARIPTRKNIKSLKRAIDAAKVASLGKSIALKRMNAAKATEQAALLDSMKSTSSGTNLKLQQESDAAVVKAKTRYAAAMVAKQKAQSQASRHSSPKTKLAAKAARKKAQQMKAMLTSATTAASTLSGSVSAGNSSVKSIRAALANAKKEKEEARRVALANPSTGNLNSFRQHIRLVHQLERRLAGLKKEALSPKMASPKVPPGTDAKGGDLVAPLIAYYCSNSKYQRICTFYKKFQASGWKDTTGQMSKQLLQKVAEAKHHLAVIKGKLASARATSASNPTKANAKQVKGMFRQVKSATRMYDAASNVVKQFMQHQTELSAKMSEATVRSQAKVAKHIKKLSTFYCSQKKYAKLCSFYQNLAKKHLREKKQGLRPYASSA
jgi:hypothetical protein